ncbi:hypothetical protein O181_022015, partial [Austropuccinia psidii MF-1]|nr:hypothetical protein [Austropuccinia psidii MF-1]
MALKYLTISLKVSSMIKCFLGQQSYNKPIGEPSCDKYWTCVMHVPPSPYLEAKLLPFDFDSSICSSMEVEYLTSDVSDTNDDDLVQTLTVAHIGQSLSWSIWELLSERGILGCFYSITGDNAANNLSMIQHPEQKYNGLNIEWPHKHRFHWCACHVINLVAKEFLSLMGKLNEEDYKFFDDYLAISRAPIDDSEDEEPLSTKEVQGNKRITARSKKQRPLNQTTLETQDQSEAIELITSNNIAPTSEIDNDPMPSG